MTSAIYAFTCVTEDGQEGIVSYMTGDRQMMPMIAASPERLDALRPMAQHVADVRRQRVTLKRYALDELTAPEVYEPVEIPLPPGVIT